MTSTQRSNPEAGSAPRAAGGNKVSDFDLYALFTDETAVYQGSADALALSAPAHKIAFLLRLFYAAGETCNEAGELMGEVKKLLRDDIGQITQTRLDKIKHEIGDTLYGLARVCRELDLRLSDMAEFNQAMLTQRKERGSIHGSGDR